MIGKTVYVVNLYPYYGVEVFANYNDAEEYLKKFAETNGFIFAEDRQTYVDRKNRSYYVYSVEIR